MDYSITLNIPIDVQFIGLKLMIYVENCFFCSQILSNLWDSKMSVKDMNISRLQ